VFLIPSVVFAAASKIPVTGLMTKPEIPYNVPLKNPLTPSFLAPSNGLKKTLKWI
jgi:hypothetical protein